MYVRIDEIRVVLWPTAMVTNHLPLVEKSLDNETIFHLCVSKC